MRYLVPASLILAGIIHLLPLPGLLGAERLAALYGLNFDEPDLSILMRHRAAATTRRSVAWWRRISSHWWRSSSGLLRTS